MNIYVILAECRVGGGDLYGVYLTLEGAKAAADAEMLRRTPSEKKLAGEEWVHMGTGILGPDRWVRHYSEYDSFVIIETELKS